MTPACSIYELACNVLRAGNPQDKTAAARTMRTLWDSDNAGMTEHHTPPRRPERPAAPVLVNPAHVKRRRLGTPAGRAALLHAVAHIEFNAIDLAADMIARFGPSPLLRDDQRAEFITDWVGVCDDEARHFGLICDRLEALSNQYGDMSAHDGLWQAAEQTADDFIARLVIAPMVLEARGLDVTPAMITKLISAADPESAAILQIIYDDEIGHVAAGRKWYAALCTATKADEINTFHEKVRIYFKGLLKPPFNRAARDLAGMPVEFYAPIAQINSNLQA